MKRIFLLLSIILLAIGITIAQKSPQYHFVKSGDVYVQYSNGPVKIVDGYSGNLIRDVEPITIAGKPFLYYWTQKGEVWCVTLNSSGKVSSRQKITCGPAYVTKIISNGESKAIFTGNNGKRYKVKFRSTGKCSGSSQI